MGDEVVLAIGSNADLADGKPLAELDQPRLGEQIPRAPAF